MSIIIYVAIGLFLLLSIGLSIYFGMKSTTPTYTFTQGRDSNSNDIGQQATLANNVPALKEWCTANPTCLGFNTNGWMKNKINNTLNVENIFSTPTQGFYTKS